MLGPQLVRRVRGAAATAASAPRVCRHRSQAPSPLAARRFAEAAAQGKGEGAVREPEPEATQMREPLVWPGAEAADAEALAARGTEWETMAAIVFERLPVLMPDPPQWEVEYHAYQEANKAVARARDIYTNPEARDMQALNDALGEEEEQAPEEGVHEIVTRVMPADLTGDRRTSARAMTERLYLLVKARDSLEPKRVVWQFPTVRYRAARPGEDEAEPATMRDTVIDGLISYLGDGVSAFPVGKAPTAHLCFELPPKQQEKHDTFGKKLFFYRVQYLGGEVELNRKRVADFAWVTKNELGDYFPRHTARRMKALLLP